MPDLDLKPDEYGKVDPKTGLRLVLDDPRVNIIGGLVGLVVLVAIFFVKDQVSADNLFWGAALFSFALGLLAYPLLIRLGR